MRLPGRDPVINICFHGIGTPRRELEPGENRYWITEDRYHEFLDEVAGRDDVALSFDDGNLSDYDIGLPALKERGLSATFFVLAGRLGTPGSLDESQVRELRDAGMGIGTHGMDHRSWRDLTGPGREREWEQARRILSHVVGRDVDEAALPLGQYDRRVLGELRRRGYRRVHTSDRRRARRTGWLQPRYSVRAEDTLAGLRADVLAGPGPVEWARRQAIGVVKRLR